MNNHKLSAWLNWWALVPAGIFTSLWLQLSISDVTGGDPSGLMHLAPVCLMIVLLVLVRKWGQLGGIAMLLAGAVILVYLFLAIQVPAGKLPGALFISGPFLLSGVLFLLAGLAKNPVPVRQ